MKKLLLFLFAPSLLAQPLPYTRVLIPVVGSVNGAYGSMWKTELIAHNAGNVAARVQASVGGVVIEQPVYPPDYTFFAPVPDMNGRGSFLYIFPASANVVFNLRVQDVSRQAQTWGTSIPIVHESDVFSGRFDLLDVPVDANFRSALRVYDWDSVGPDPRQVRLRIYDLCGLGLFDGKCTNAPLVDTTVTLVGGTPDFTMPTTPAFASIADLVAAFPILATVKPQQTGPTAIRPPAVRIELEPITAGIRIWAFVSATNNETQHVTVITPAR